MDRAYLLEVARRASGLTQSELAARSGTSQATLSAYERGLKSPTLKVAARILEAAGFDLNLRRLIDWVEHEAPGVGRFWVPNLLWNVETPDCFATLKVVDTDHDPPIRDCDMHDRAQRKQAYEHLILRCDPEDMLRWLDGPLLVDLWDELELPRPPTLEAPSYASFVHHSRASLERKVMHVPLLRSHRNGQSSRQRDEPLSPTTCR